MWRATQPFSDTAHQLQTLTVEALLEDEEDWEHPYSAIVIHTLDTEQSADIPVAWMELLSPTNKGNSQDAQTYRAKQRLLLEQQIIFVEVDYVHETPPTFTQFADYSFHQIDSHPFRIIVLDPRPDFRHGPVTHVEFDVDEIIGH